MSMGCACKFFGFSIAKTVLNLPLSILYLCNYVSKSLYIFPHFPLLLPANNPPNDLHIYDSTPVLVVCLCFLESVVDSLWVCYIQQFNILYNPPSTRVTANASLHFEFPRNSIQFIETSHSPRTPGWHMQCLMPSANILLGSQSALHRGCPRDIPYSCL